MALDVTILLLSLSFLLPPPLDEREAPQFDCEDGRFREDLVFSSSAFLRPFLSSQRDFRCVPTELLEKTCYLFRGTFFSYPKGFPDGFLPLRFSRLFFCRFLDTHERPSSCQIFASRCGFVCPTGAVPSPSPLSKPRTRDLSFCLPTFMFSCPLAWVHVGTGAWSPPLPSRWKSLRPRAAESSSVPFFAVCVFGFF